jgi:hypothetical protein
MLGAEIGRRLPEPYPGSAEPTWSGVGGRPPGRSAPRLTVANGPSPERLEKQLDVVVASVHSDAEDAAGEPVRRRGLLQRRRGVQHSRRDQLPAGAAAGPAEAPALTGRGDRLRVRHRHRRARPGGSSTGRATASSRRSSAAFRSSGSSTRGRPRNCSRPSDPRRIAGPARGRYGPVVNVQLWVVSGLFAVSRMAAVPPVKVTVY